MPGWRPQLINNPAADEDSIIACRIIEASSAHHTMTKGGLSPDYERMELIWPSATQEYQTPLWINVTAKADEDLCPSFPMDTTICS